MNFIREIWPILFAIAAVVAIFIASSYVFQDYLAGGIFSVLLMLCGFLEERLTRKLLNRKVRRKSDD
jgi:uncharacterized membrane protein